MNYDLPEIPTGQRWNVSPSIVKGITDLALQEKRWWGWKKIAGASIYNDRVLAGGLRSAADRILDRTKAEVQYGTKEGTL